MAKRISKHELTRRKNRDRFRAMLRREGKIKMKDKYVNVSTKIDFICLVCDHIWGTTPNHVKSAGYGCPECFKREQQVRFKQRFRNYLKEENIKLLSDIKTYKDKVKLECMVCGDIFEKTPQILKLHDSSGCTKCRQIKRLEKNKREFLEYLATRDDLIMIGEYLGKSRKVEFQCNDCKNRWEAIPNDVMSIDTGCPICKQSKGEREIDKYLSNNDVHFIRQWTHKNCYYKNLLRFDFYLPDYNLVIEYHGVQHYKFIKFFHRNKDRYLECKKRDQIKKDFCRKTKIYYLEISYKEKDNIENILKNVLYTTIKKRA